MPSRGRAVATLTLGAGPAGVGWALADALRVWLPSLVLTGGGPGGTRAVIAGAAAVTAAPVLASILVLRVPARVIWLVTAATLLGARLALATSSGGSPQRWTAAIAVAGGMAAVVALAAGSPRGDVARAGLLIGTAGSWALLAGLHGIDLAWRTGPAARLATLGLVVLAGLGAIRTARGLDGGRGAAARPWALVGPGLALVGLVGAPSGRIAVATGWDAGRAGAVAVLLCLVLVLTVLGAVRLGPLTAGPGAAILVLGGTAAAVDPTSIWSVVGQVATMAGVGAGWGAGPRGLATGPGRRGLIAAATWIAFGTIVLAHHAAVAIAVPWDARTVVVATAILLATASLAGTVRAARHGREPVVVGPLAAAALAVPAAIVLALAAAVRPAPDPGPSAPDTVRVVQANVNLGFDPEGRRRASEFGAALAALDADVIVLNEVDRGRYTTGAADLLATYTTATGLTAVFGPTSDALHGTAVLTRLTVLEVIRQTLPGGADPRTRAALTVVLERPDGERFAVVATRLSDLDRRGDTRLPQAQVVAGIVARLRERGLDALVVGDLASPPGDPALTVLEELLVRALPDSVRTYPATAPRVQVDHVLVPSTWTVETTRALNTGLTDHRVVDVLLRPGAAEADVAADGPRSR